MILYQLIIAFCRHLVLLLKLGSMSVGSEHSDLCVSYGFMSLLHDLGIWINFDLHFVHKTYS